MLIIHSSSCTAQHTVDPREKLFPFRPLQDAESILAFGSDWPIAEPDVIRAIAIAVRAETEAESGKDLRRTLQHRSRAGAQPLTACPVRAFGRGRSR